MSVDVSILIVNYNTCRLTMDCLRSVYDSETNFSYEIILIDNNSRDESVETISREFPDVTLIANQENTGFARANNQGMEISSGRYVLLLNSDTVVRKDTLETMISFMDNRPDVGASGCKIILPDGSLDKACKRGFPTPSASFYYAFGFSKLFPDKPRFNGYQLGYLDPDLDYPVDCLVGAFMLLRRETIEQVGGLDEEFFMFDEDLDWCPCIGNEKNTDRNKKNIFVFVFLFFNSSMLIWVDSTFACQDRVKNRGKMRKMGL